jgi:hypothetical protein
MVCSLELGSISQSQNQLSKFKKAVGSLLLLQHKLSWPQKGGPPIVSSKVRILALQLSTWPSAYDATPCHEWRSTWVLVSVKLSVHHFNIAKSYHQMFPLNLSIPIILVCSKLLYIMTLICLFVCLYVASPPPQLCSEICRCMYNCEKFMAIIWILKVWCMAMVNQPTLVHSPCWRRLLSGHQI